MNKMIFIILYFLFSLHLISLTHCNPDDKPTRITFDSKNINKDDFNIYKITNPKSTFISDSFQFVPKNGKLVDKIVLDGVTVWRELDETFFVDITVVENHSIILYSVKLKDRDNREHLVHVESFQMILKHVGLIEYLNYMYNHEKDAKVLNRFNMTSMFDYNYVLKTETKSCDNALQTTKFESYFTNKFDEIYDGTELIYSGEKVKFVTLEIKHSQRFLLKLEINYGDYVYFYFDNNWKKINKKIFDKLYSENNYKSCIWPISNLLKTDITKFNLAHHFNSYFFLYFNHTLMTVPTITLIFTKIEELYEGDQLIFHKPLRNGNLILYKGENSYEMIEVLSNNGPHYDSSSDFLSDLNNKSDVNSVRNLNNYFIKRNGTWEESSQLEFLDYFKRMVISNLEKYNSQMEKITSDPKPSKSTLDVDEIKNNIKNNKELIHFLKNLSLGNDGNKVQTTIQDYLDLVTFDYEAVIKKCKETFESTRLLVTNAGSSSKPTSTNNNTPAGSNPPDSKGGEAQRRQECHTPPFEKDLNPKRNGTDVGSPSHTSHIGRTLGRMGKKPDLDLRGRGETSEEWTREPIQKNKKKHTKLHTHQDSKQHVHNFEDDLTALDSSEESEPTREPLYTKEEKVNPKPETQVTKDPTGGITEEHTLETSKPGENTQKDGKPTKKGKTKKDGHRDSFCVPSLLSIPLFLFLV